jgi:L-amino acid N-acyltransferase
MVQRNKKTLAPAVTPTAAQPTPDMPTIRDATPADLNGILAIYNHAVAHTTAIWNETLVDIPNRAKWLADRQALGYPVLVAIGPGTKLVPAGVVGYASFGDWRAFDGYRYTVEHSVYVSADARGQGVGRILMAGLIERARNLGKHVMVGAVEAGNAPSLALHRRLGFVQTGLMSQVGTKFGRWLDLAWVQLQLNDAAPLR